MSLWRLAWCPPHSRLALIYFHWLEKSSQLLCPWVLLELRWGALWTNSGLQRSICYLGRLKIARASVPQLLVSLRVISHQINYTPQHGDSVQITNTSVFSKGNGFEMAKTQSEFQEYVTICENTLIWYSPTCLFLLRCLCFWHQIQKFIAKTHVRELIACMF